MNMQSKQTTIYIGLNDSETGSSKSLQRIFVLFFIWLYTGDLAYLDKHGAVTDEQIRDIAERDIDRINSNMPKYKHVHRLILQKEEMAKTTTGKVKRYEEKESGVR